MYVHFVALFNQGLTFLKQSKVSYTFSFWTWKVGKRVKWGVSCWRNRPFQANQTLRQSTIHGTWSIQGSPIQWILWCLLTWIIALANLRMQDTLRQVWLFRVVRPSHVWEWETHCESEMVSWNHEHHYQSMGLQIYQAPELQRYLWCLKKRDCKHLWQWGPGRHGFIKSHRSISS